MKDNKQFGDWLMERFYQSHRHSPNIDTIKYFKALYPAMQWGVYLEFFDSVGIRIVFEWEDDEWDVLVGGVWLIDAYNTRQEAQQAAIKKAFEILEQ
tara:strand:+ start:714 stop:1004 length:291 start_codon:yes stop_codon:yes gene_type:complete